LRTRLTDVSDTAGLYAILNKVSKNERQTLSNPLKIVRYVGTLTTTDIQTRFKEYCEPKAENSRRFVFNSEDHCIVPVMNYDA
jgi:hypothetical protein